MLEPPSAENVPAIEVVMMSRPARPLQQHRDALGCHNKVATAWAAAAVSRLQQRQLWSWCAPGGGDGTVVMVLIASSGSPSQLYVTLRGQFQEDVSAEESVAQPQGAAVVGGQQQQEYQPQPQQYADCSGLRSRFKQMTTRRGSRGKQKKHQSRFAEHRSSQCSTRSSYRSTSSLPSIRHPVSSSRGNTCSSLYSFHCTSSLSSSIRTSSSSSFHRTSSRCRSSNPSRRLSEFYESLVCHTLERQCDVMVDLPSGDYMCSFGYLEGVTVEVQGHQLPVRLYVNQLRDFDVILGMDWLEAHSAVVDYQWKTVRFEIHRALVLCFRGDVLVVLGARRRWSFRREGPNGSTLLVERQGACRAEETGR
ncbi:hypothetical protein Taro_005420 [Colocasia esculenta]|uniref:Uncharacterized protein n=1 Tax=Colocasia esculenta TaxID=4460 RepID=A0A843TUB4_COLES|nr:hypothetical protein [Colocasia esculenta]